MPVARGSLKPPLLPQTAAFRDCCHPRASPERAVLISQKPDPTVLGQGEAGAAKSGRDVRGSALGEPQPPSRSPAPFPSSSLPSCFSFLPPAPSFLLLSQLSAPPRKKGLSLKPATFNPNQEAGGGRRCPFPPERATSPSEQDPQGGKRQQGGDTDSTGRAEGLHPKSHSPLRWVLVQPPRSDGGGELRGGRALHAVAERTGAGAVVAPASACAGEREPSRGGGVMRW